MTIPTANPVPSQAPTDLLFNAEKIDQFLNGETPNFSDRFGRVRRTYAALEAEYPNAQANAEAAEESAGIAATARDEAQTLAATAEAARDGAIAGAELYPDEATGRAAVADEKTFNVQGTGAVAAYQYRRISSTTSTLLATFPAAAAVEDLQGLIAGTAPSEPIEAVTDDEGGIHRLHMPTMIEDSVHRVEELSGGAAILGEDGGIVLYQDDERTILGPLEVGHTDLPGVYVVDSDGGVHADLAGDSPAEAVAELSPLAGGAFFSGVLVGAHGVPISVHVPSLIAERLRGAEVVATLNSTAAPLAVSASDTLSALPESLGSSAQLVLRDRINPADRMVRTLNVKTVPVPAVAPSPVRVLYVGDSIGNRQGLQFLDTFLTGWGYTPQWVGTMRSASVAGNANDTTGPLGECREGWETGDYTFAVTDRALIVEPGQEAAYLAMSKPDQWPHNPFLRAATGSDALEDARNGYVVDFAFYQSRFSLQPPDVVVWSLGTNDARDLSDAEIYSAISSNDALIYRRIKAAWPGAKIIRTLPGTSIDPTREALWTSKYVPMLRAMADAAAGVSGLTVAPAWAMVNQEAAYSFAASPDPTTGFTSLPGWSDAIHPPGASRLALYQSLAPYIAAAGLNLI